MRTFNSIWENGWIWRLETISVDGIEEWTDLVWIFNKKSVEIENSLLSDKFSNLNILLSDTKSNQEFQAILLHEK